MWFTTKVKTKDNFIYDLGELEYPPKHDHKGGMCNECQVINAWTEGCVTWFCTGCSLDKPTSQFNEEPQIPFICKV